MWCVHNQNNNRFFGFRNFEMDILRKRPEAWRSRKESVEPVLYRPVPQHAQDDGEFALRIREVIQRLQLYEKHHEIAGKVGRHCILIRKGRNPRGADVCGAVEV